MIRCDNARISEKNIIQTSERYSNMHHQKRTIVRIFSLTAALCLLGACATHQAKKTDTAGFLGDYSQLKKGGDDQALLVYNNPQADIKSYTSILMDPIRIYASKEHNMMNVSSEQQRKILNYANAAVREKLETDYTFVEEPGPGVMRLRIALTEAEGSRVVLDTVSTIVPIGLALSGIQKLATGSCSFVGSAGAEMELQDSLTGERLMAGVDRRIGGKVTGEFDKFNKWRTVKNAVDYWAERLQMRLAEQRTQ
jgi:hypothetical protein